MKKHKPTIIRGSFDGIANKFDKNIYGTTKGQLRHQLLLHHLSPYIDNGFSEHKKQLKVLDVGGGTGMMALEFAKQGHNILLNDISADALDIAKQRLSPFSNASVELSSFKDITDTYDFIVCHALLEWLDEPLTAISLLVDQLTPGGVISLSFFNYDAKVFTNLLYGNFDYVELGLPSRNTVRLNPHNAQQPSRVIDYIKQQKNVEIIGSNGIRCIHDYMLDKTRIAPQYNKLFELELHYGAIEPYKSLGKYFHLLLKKH